MFTKDTKNPGNLPVSHWNFKDFREKNSVFTDVTAYTFAGAGMTTGKETTGVTIEVASGNYFDVLGVKALLGRTFLPDEDKTPDTESCRRDELWFVAAGLWRRSVHRWQNYLVKPTAIHRHRCNSAGFRRHRPWRRHRHVGADYDA